MKNWREVFNPNKFKNYILRNKSKLPNMAEFSGDIFPGTGDSAKIELNSWHSSNHLFEKDKEKEQTTNLGSSLMNKNVRGESIADIITKSNKVSLSWRIYNDFSSLDQKYTLRTGRLPKNSDDKLQGINLSNWGVGISRGGVKFAVAQDIFRYIFAIENNDSFSVDHYSVDYKDLVENNINPYDFNEVINFVLEYVDIHDSTENTDLDTMLEEEGVNIVAISKKIEWRKIFSDVQFKQKPDGTVEIAVEYPPASSTPSNVDMNQNFETPVQNNAANTLQGAEEIPVEQPSTEKVTSSWKNTLSTLDFKQKSDGTTELHVEETFDNNNDSNSTDEASIIKVSPGVSANLRLDNKNSCNSKVEKEWIIRQKGNLVLKGKECEEAYGIVLEKQGKIIDSERIGKTNRINNWREVINSAVWENKFDVLAGIGTDSTELTHNEDDSINVSGLFFFDSHINNKLKIEIAKWYKSLGQTEREYVDILIREARDEEQFFSQGD